MSASDTPRTDAVKGYEARCEMHGDKIVTHAMCFARASEEADELRELCEKLERELAAAAARPTIKNDKTQEKVAWYHPSELKVIGNVWDSYANK